MREIKFRAWKKQRDGSFKMDYNPHIYDGECMGEFPMVNINKALSSGGDATGNGEDVFMQYTGLKDKNGKEIYEGDIVKGIGIKDETKNRHRIIKWKTAGFFVEQGSWDDEFGTPLNLIFNRPDRWRIENFGKQLDVDCEVIGNIYENPDLLPVSKESK